MRPPTDGRCLASLFLLAVASITLAVASPAARGVVPASVPSRRLHGRFLHITDLHPDEFYRAGSDPGHGNACHRGHGSAGVYGAEKTSCDSPSALIDATFDWIDRNVKDKVDFVIWTGDSARHGSDDQHPRDADGILDSNRAVAAKFLDTFAAPDGRLSVPVVPTFGNNDFLPHNTIKAGPNSWFLAYSDIWKRFIPHEQRREFRQGGWFSVEVIPGRLAVISLNTMFFFQRNDAVLGCARPSEPGYEHMEWLREQLQRMREAGIKAILMGHVPPARTDSKQNWDETCWQRYTLWLRQYRDVVTASLYGHMNIDHFMLQDTKDVALGGEPGDDDDDDNDDEDDDDDDDDDDDETTTPHLRGPEHVGVGDTGLQAVTTSFVGDAGVSMRHIDVEAAVGRRLTARDEEGAATERNMVVDEDEPCSTMQVHHAHEDDDDVDDDDDDGDNVQSHDDAADSSSPQTLAASEDGPPSAAVKREADLFLETEAPKRVREEGHDGDGVVVRPHSSSPATIGGEDGVDDAMEGT